MTQEEASEAADRVMNRVFREPDLFTQKEMQFISALAWRIKKQPGEMRQSDLVIYELLDILHEHNDLNNG